MTLKKLMMAIVAAFAAISSPVAPGLTTARADDAVATATWRQPTPAEVRRQVIDWLAGLKLDGAARERAAAQWPADLPAGGGDLLDRFAATTAIVDPRAASVRDYARTGDTSTQRPDVAWLGDGKVSPLVRNNLRLLLGRRLTQLQLFDEALEQINGLQTEEVIDPASLLFYSAMANHRLLKRDEGLAAVSRLLERRRELPQRYAALAILMEADLRQLKDETLDHISRRMEDIERHLDLGRSGQKVRDIEEGVVKSLDKLIKELEDQMQASASANSIRSSAPAQDSIAARGKAPGLVTKKDVGKNTAWGDLPPKERQEAMQEIGRDFPANYREVIEEFFRQQANTDANED